MDELKPNATGADAQKSSGLMGKLRDGANTQLSNQKDRATEGLGSVARAVRQTTQQLRDQHHETAAHYVEQAANQIERFSNRLKEKNVSELLQNAQDLARRQPAIFVGSAFAVGLLGARFFKSSSREREAAQRDFQSDWRQGMQGGDYPSLPTAGTTVAGRRLDHPPTERF